MSNRRLLAGGSNTLTLSTFAGLNIAPGPLIYTKANGYQINDTWNYDDYQWSYGTSDRSCYFKTLPSTLPSYGGYSDWRLPSPTEMTAILPYNESFDDSYRTGAVTGGSIHIHWVKLKVSDVYTFAATQMAGILIFPDDISADDLPGYGTVFGWGDCDTPGDYFSLSMSSNDIQAHIDIGCVFLPAWGCYTGSQWYGAGEYGFYNEGSGSNPAYQLRMNNRTVLSESKNSSYYLLTRLVRPAY